MNNRSKLALIGSLLGLVVVSGCTKTASNPYYTGGAAPTLSASSSTIAPTPADSLSNAVVFSWTDPKYSGATPGGNLFTLQIDSTGRGFAKAVSITVSGGLVDSLTAKQLNTILLGFGFNFNVQYSVDVRVIAAYSNNNDQLFSNTLTLKVTPYKIPPKVQPPTGTLYLVGSASQGGWNAPVPVPTQVFEEVDSVDYAGVFNLTAGGQFLILPQNDGTYTNKLATSDASETGTGGTFNYNAANNFTGPATAGWYTIWLNFQQGTMTITPFAAPGVPDSLFLVGNATAWGWNNPVPEPLQVLTRINSSQFSITIALVANGQYLLLPVNGSWTNKYAVGASANAVTGGTFGYNLANNFNGPATSGNYKIVADFAQYTYTVTPE